MSIEYAHPFSLPAPAPPNRRLQPRRPAQADARPELAPLPETSNRELLRALDAVEDALEGWHLRSSDPTSLVQLSHSLAGSHTLGQDALPRLSLLLARISLLLSIPRAFELDDDEMEMETDLESERQQFLSHSPALLSLALALVLLVPLPPPAYKPTQEELEERATLVLVFGRFTQSDLCAFCAPSSVPVALQITSRLFSATPRLPLISFILSTTFPPLFSPHPKLNPSTGRVLPPSKAGDLLDWYSTGSWRSSSGLSSVVRCVVAQLGPDEVEGVWGVVLPPVLAYLDDWEPRNKLVGVGIVDALLEVVSGSLLRRTGVGEVLSQSLSSSLSSLSSPHSPALLTHCTSTSLTLLALLHSPTSSAHSHALATLLQSSTITPWSFHSGSLPLELSIARSLPSLVLALGFGTIRWLGIFVPHLTSLIGDTSIGEGTWELVQAAARALESVMRVAKEAGREPRWKGLVAGAVGRCWVKLGETHGVHRDRVEQRLRAVLDAIGDETVGQRLASVGKELEGLCVAVVV